MNNNMTKLNENKVADLIEKITPLNNEYRDRIRLKSGGTEILELMWKVGAILELFLKKERIKPHNLYWQVYGKAPGLKKSYITRDFLSYCLRIKKFFPKYKNIKEIFPELKKYSLFREAFPLLENPKYKLIEDEYNKLVRILNSNKDSSEIKSHILNLKNKKIGIKNPRTQRLAELKDEVDNFVNIFNYVYELIKKDNANDIRTFRNKFSNKLILELSQLIASFTQEGLSYPEIKQYNHLPRNWINFIDNLKRLSKTNIETRNRFRRLVPPRKLMDLADMLNATISDRGIKNYRIKKKLIKVEELIEK